jgi:hypothetical protein
VVKGYPYEGVNRETGLFQFRDDLAAGGNLDVHYYGSCEQSLRYKNWQLDLFLEFRRQSGVNPFVTLYQMEPPGFLAPAMIGNAPSAWLHRWQHPGDQASLQQVTEYTGSAASVAIENYVSSDARSIDASFIRWKGLTLSYRMPRKWLSSLGLKEAQVYLKGQNLLTFTRFPVTDPETQDPTVLPPTRSLAAGIRLNF